MVANGARVLQFDNGTIATIGLSKGQLLDLERVEDRFLMVRSGMLKVEHLNPDGTPEVAAFLLIGEPVVSSLAHLPVAITALEDTRLCRLDPARLSFLPDRSSELALVLTRAVADQATQDQQRLINARTGAIADRLLWFLSDMSQRQRTNLVTLAMNRTDIAHYLDTTAESVSRAFAELDRDGAIRRETPKRISVLVDVRIPNLPPRLSS